ncbi:TEL2-interacting protein 1 [Rhizophlyctis rosea]|nr:TEL2-interacting protein 1 [Rhizophlyctis rosea]
MSTSSNIEKTLRIVSFLLDKAETFPVPLFREFLVGLPVIVSNGRVGRSPQKRVSEETKMAAVECIMAIMLMAAKIREANHEDQVDLSQPEYHPVLAHTIMVLLETLEKERNLQLRVLCVTTLKKTLEIADNPDVLARFLPGISSNFIKVLTQDDKENHKLIVPGVETMGFLLSRVFNDQDANQILGEKDLSWNSLLNKAKGPKHSGGLNGNMSGSGKSTGGVSGARSSVTSGPPSTPARDGAWHIATLPRIGQMLRILLQIRHHAHWKVRLAFLRFASSLITTSARMLAPSIPILVDTVVLYVDDEYPAVALECGQKVASLAGTVGSDFELSSTLKANFHSLLLSLPRILTKSTDAQQLETISRANGYLLLLREQMAVTLNTCFDRLSSGLLDALTFDTSDVRVVEDRLLGGRLEDLPATTQGGYGGGSGSLRFPRRRFQNLHDDRVIAGVGQMFRLVGRYSDLAFIVDHLMSYIRGGRPGDFEAPGLFVLNEVLLGAGNVDRVDVKNSDAMRSLGPITRSLVREFAYSDILQAPISSEEWEHSQEMRITAGSERALVAAEADSTPSHGTFNLSIVKISLLLETIASAAMILGTQFAPLFVDVLYHILEILGSANRMISDSAMSALRVIASACGYEGEKDAVKVVGRMVLDNVDYVVNAVSQRMRNIALNPRVPDVLIATTRVAGRGIVQYMDDTVDEILDALDEWHATNHQLVSNLVRALSALVEVIPTDSEDTLDDHHTTDRSSTIDTNTVQTPSDVPAPFQHCSPEIQQFYLKHRRKQDVHPDVAANGGRNQQTIDEIKEFFMTSKSGDADQLEGPESDHPGPTDPEPKETPLSHQQTLTLKIMRKAIHFTSGPSPHLRSQTIRLLRLSLPVLNGSKELMPQIHAIWPLITMRLGDSESWVVEQAMEAVRVCCVLGKDFTRTRVAKDVIPRVTVLMNKLDVGQLRERRYHRSVVKMLQAFGDIVASVPISGRDARAVADPVLGLVDSDVYGDELAGSAERVLEAVIGTGGGDAIWLAAWIASGGSSLLHRPGLSRPQIPKWLQNKVRMGGEAYQAALRRLVDKSASVGKPIGNLAGQPVAGR